MDDNFDSYQARGRECAFANAKIVGRLLGAIYDDHFRSVGLRASQVAVLWAIWASEPVVMARLGEHLALDQTTTSRTVSNLRRLGLVQVQAGKHDGRERKLILTSEGKSKLVSALPMWEEAQREISGLFDVDRLREFSRIARKTHKQRAVKK